MGNDLSDVQMFEEEEYKMLNEASEKLHDELAALQPFHVMLAQATYQMVRLPAALTKIYEQLEENNLLLNELLVEMQLMGKSIRRKTESPSLSLLPEHNAKIA